MCLWCFVLQAPSLVLRGPPCWDHRSLCVVLSAATSVFHTDIWEMKMNDACLLVLRAEIEKGNRLPFLMLLVTSSGASFCLAAIVQWGPLLLAAAGNNEALSLFYKSTQVPY